MKKFYLRLAYLSQSQLINEIGHFLQRGIDHLMVAAYHTEAQNRALPEILSVTLGDGNIELMGYPRLDTLQHASFPFERVILREDEA